MALHSPLFNNPPKHALCEKRSGCLPEGQKNKAFPMEHSRSVTNKWSLAS